MQDTDDNRKLNIITSLKYGIGRIILIKMYFIFITVFSAACISGKSKDHIDKDSSDTGNLQNLEVSFTIEPGQDNHPISPLIYGTNSTINSEQNFNFFRLGGNRLTGYNWENNWSSAGSDWYHSNDGYLIPEGSDGSEPALSNRFLMDHAVDWGAQVLLTVPLAGYVAADGNGEVFESETAPSSRWIPIYPAKDKATFSLNPDLSDNAVYINEFVNLMVNTYGYANEGGILAYSLDNEPGLWADTHPRIHPSKVQVQELTDKSLATAAAIKDVDPSCLIYGPALYGFSAYLNLQEAPDWSDDLKNKYSWFIDYYLDRMKLAENNSGTRLLDVLDLHWYPEATGDARITSSSANSRQDRIARLQAPRSLWDPEYQENSWIAKYFSDYLPLIPKVTQSIQDFYPGTKLAFTEFNYGGGHDITGGIAQADVLGIFGKYNVYAASIWDFNAESKFITLAYQLFRNYDGANSTFGDLSVKSEMTDKENTSIYSAKNTKSGNLHIIVINKNLDNQVFGTFTIDASETYSSASVYKLSEQQDSIENAGILSLSENSFSYNIAPVSALHFVLTN